MGAQALDGWIPLDAHACRLVELVDNRRDELATAVLARIRHELPTYAVLPDEHITPRLDQSIHFVAQLLLTEGVQSPTMLAAFTDLGRTRRREGIASDTLIRAVRIAAREAVDFAQQRAQDVGVDARASLTLVTALWDWVEVIVGELSPERARSDDDEARQVADRRFVRLVVSGEANADEVAAAAEACDLDPTLRYAVVRAEVEHAHGVADTRAALRPARRVGAAVTLSDEWLAVVSEVHARDIPFPAGLGPFLPLAAGRESYLLAGRALRTAQRFGRHGLVSLRDVGLQAAVLQDDDVSAVLHDRYLVPLNALGEFGEQLLSSVRTYFVNQQSVEDASRCLYIHPNTLRHRLMRFEEVTNCSLRNPEHLAEVWWLLMRQAAEP